MNFLDLIEKKKRKESLKYSEMLQAFNQYLQGDIPEYQMSAFLMAIYFQGMDDEEIINLTKIMVDSGDKVDLQGVEGIKVDKHSTGGVGDSTTLVLGPILASCGLKMAKMSGKGLGHTGGTLDKLESIPGFNYELDTKEIVSLTNINGIAISGQTANITPLDKRLYDLRNASATVDSIPLIASSIMCKKLAIESDVILLDVKVGEGAFMKDLSQARLLAKKLVQIGQAFGRKTIAILSSMDQPLGRAIGNSLEVEEAFETLKGKGPDDLKELCLHFSGKILSLANSISYEQARDIAQEALISGAALNKAKEMILSQKGDARVIEDYSLLPQAQYSLEVVSDKKGFLNLLPALEVGSIARDLGAGRINLDDKLDLSAGIVLHKKCGDKVDVGDSLATLYGNNKDLLIGKQKEFLNILGIDEVRKILQSLLLEEVGYGV